MFALGGILFGQGLSALYLTGCKIPKNVAGIEVIMGMIFLCIAWYQAGRDQR